jgi:hypothetical protein
MAAGWAFHTCTSLRLEWDDRRSTISEAGDLDVHGDTGSSRASSSGFLERAVRSYSIEPIFQ